MLAAKRKTPGGLSAERGIRRPDADSAHGIRVLATCATAGWHCQGDPAEAHRRAPAVESGAGASSIAIVDDGREEPHWNLGALIRLVDPNAGSLQLVFHLASVLVRISARAWKLISPNVSVLAPRRFVWNATSTMLQPHGQHLRQSAQAVAALWRFVSNPAVEPTNNAAEQALRGTLLKRKISGPTRSRRGDEFIARGFSVHETCRRQGLDLWAYLHRAVVAWIDELPHPSLLPAAAPSG